MLQAFMLKRFSIDRCCASFGISDGVEVWTRESHMLRWTIPGKGDMNL